MEIEATAKAYQEQLDEEIRKDREAHGKRPLKKMMTATITKMETSVELAKEKPLRKAQQTQKADCFIKESTKSNLLM